MEKPNCIDLGLGPLEAAEKNLAEEQIASVVEAFHTDQLVAALVEEVRAAQLDGYDLNLN